MTELSSLITKINDLDNNLLSLIFGEQALKIKTFLNSLDLEHPDIKSLFNDFLNSDFFDIFDDALNAIQHNKKTSKISCLFSETTLRDYFLKKIKFPNETRVNVRFLKDDNERNQIRLSKKNITIDMDSTYKKGIYYYESQPINFDDFFRHNLGYRKELDKLEKRQKKYNSLGCISLAQSIKTSIDLYKKYSESTYYGFNRILMSHACVILAKFLGFSYINSSPPKIKIDKKNFNIQNVTEKYRPRIYPYHELQHIATDKTKEIINNLDHFPESKGKPIFDHFGVIVPGFDCDDQNIKDLEILYLQKNKLPAVILGEKDGECFFIDFFIFTQLSHV